MVGKAKVNLMKRMKKARLSQVWRLARQWNKKRLYYWADRRLPDLRSVCVMPRGYYYWRYRTCMHLAAVGKCVRPADRAIHTIPYPVRFEMA